MSRVSSKRTGSAEPFKRANGATYFRARIRLADGSRVRVDIPDKYCTPAGGKTARERAELYAAAAQEREDETGNLLLEKRQKLGLPTDDASTRFYAAYVAWCRDTSRVPVCARIYLSEIAEMHAMVVGGEA